MRWQKKFKWASSALIVIVFTATNAAALPNLSLIKQRLIRYHDSGQYYYQIDQVEQKAQKFLAKAVAENKQAKTKRKLALVLDIDETALSNYRSLRLLNFGGTEQQITQGLLVGNDPAIPATYKLYHYAITHGVTVFFVTGRKEFMRKSTVKNLEQAGYKSYAKLYMKPNDYNKKSVIFYKSNTRKKIEDQGYEIIVNIGDQFSDLAGGYADRDYKYPDPFYYIP